MIAVCVYRAHLVNWRAAGLGVLLALGSLVPYLAEQATHQFADVTGLLEPVTDEHPSLPAALAAGVARTVQLSGSAGWSYVTGQSQDAFVLSAGAEHSVASIASVIAGALLIVGMAKLALETGHAVHRRRNFPFFALPTADERRGVLLVGSSESGCRSSQPASRRCTRTIWSSRTPCPSS